MGPFGDRASERFKETMHGLSNEMTILHAGIIALKLRHLAGLPAPVQELIRELDDACTRAMAHVHGLHKEL